jgi:hypothetical protein
MAPIKADKNAAEAQSAWEPPVVTKVLIGAETKSAANSEKNPVFDEPQPPTSPTSKLGFSFEMALPLSARNAK